LIYYQYDSDNRFCGVVESKEQLANTTSVKPQDGLYNPKWTGSAWIGDTAEQFAIDNPIDPIEPTPEQQMIAALMAKFTELEGKNE